MYNVNSLKDALTIPKGDIEIPGSQIILFSNLMKNDAFKEQFVNTFMDMLNTNFSQEHLDSLLDQMVNEYEPYMEDYFARFGNSHPPTLPVPMNAFRVGVKELKLFTSNRNDYVPDMLKDTLNLQGKPVNITVSVNDANAGSIKINTITPDMKDGAFTGQYFEDYEITLTAQPKDGYSFTGWSGASDSTESTIKVKPSDLSKYEAQFSKN